MLRVPAPLSRQCSPVPEPSRRAGSWCHRHAHAAIERLRGEHPSGAPEQRERERTKVSRVGWGDAEVPRQQHRGASRGNEDGGGGWGGVTAHTPVRPCVARCYLYRGRRLAWGQSRPRAILAWGEPCRCPGHILGAAGGAAGGSRTGTVPVPMTGVLPQPSRFTPHSPPPCHAPPRSTTKRPARRGRSQPRRCPRLTHILRPRPRRFPAPPPTARGGGAGGPPEPAPRCSPTGDRRPTGRDPRGGRHPLPEAAGERTVPAAGRTGAPRPSRAAP